MKFIALISGGKDSIYTIQNAILQYNHELLCTAYIHPPKDTSQETRLESNSFMFQSIGSNLIPTISSCLGVPNYTITSNAKSICTSLQYTIQSDDEVEDLYTLLSEIKTKHPDVEAVTAGAILSSYQRIRLEHVCSRLNLTILSYLWRIGSQPNLLKCMISDRINAILIKVATIGLSPKKCLGKSIQELYPTFSKVQDTFGCFQYCGEGGEYETLVLDCPIYKKRIVIDEFEIVYLDGDSENDDGLLNYDGMVGLYYIKKFHVEEKSLGEIEDGVRELKERIGIDLVDRVRSQGEDGYVRWNPLNELKESKQKDDSNTNHQITILPHAKIQAKSGIIHLSSLTSPSQNNDAVQEFQQILTKLQSYLNHIKTSSQDIIMVHLYLSKISLFSKINIYYKEFFGSVLPPSRSCVAVPLSNCNVMLDALILKNSGTSLRNNETAKRNVLHVQGISSWAPVCVGPYSQANTLYQGVTFLAGQIGLIPYSMTFPKTWEEQLVQAWRNVANVIDALERCAIADVALGILIYLHPCIQNWEYVYDISVRALEDNAGIVPGYVDEVESRSSNLDPKTSIDIFMICTPEMPLGALVEIEVVCCTKKAVDALPLQFYNTVTTTYSHNKDIEDEVSSIPSWDCEPICNTITPIYNPECTTIELSCRYLSHSASIISIHVKTTNSICYNNTCHEILQTLKQSLTRINLCQQDILNLRIYYISSLGLEDLKRALFIQLGSLCCDVPAVTFVPVLGLREGVLFGMHVLVCNLKHLDTEIWVHSSR